MLKSYLNDGLDHKDNLGVRPTTIAVNARWTIDLQEDTEIKSFLPISFILIKNGSRTDIDIYQDTHFVVRILEGLNEVIEGADACRYLQIVNVGVQEIKQNELVITVGKGPRVSGGVPISPPKIKNVYNIKMTTANTWYSQKLPANTKAWKLHCRTHNDIKYAFADNPDVWMTLKKGQSIEEDTNPGTIYVLCETADKTVEIEAWV